MAPVSPFPPTPALIMDWAVQELVGSGQGDGLDSSTIQLHFSAIHDIIDYARTRLGLRSLSNPLRDPEVVAFTKIVGANYKKRSKARTSVTLLTARLMLLHGWDVRTRAGRWGRLRWVFLNLGMLRVGCVSRLIINYEIVTSPRGRIVKGYRGGHEQGGHEQGGPGERLGNGGGDSR